MFGQKAINRTIRDSRGPTAGRIGTSKSKPGVGRAVATPGAKLFPKEMKRAMPNPAGVAMPMPPMPMKGRRV